MLIFVRMQRKSQYHNLLTGKWKGGLDGRGGGGGGKGNECESTDFVIKPKMRSESLRDVCSLCHT